jgi:hypothetical protein
VFSVGCQCDIKCSRWSIAGHIVCFKNFCHLLSISTATVRDYIAIVPEKGNMSKRRKGGKPGPKQMGQQSLHVDFFFQEYYQSAGEPLPKTTAVSCVRAGTSSDTDVQIEVGGVLGPWLNSGDRINGADDDTYDPDRPVVDTTAMLTAAAHGQVVGLPMRFLHHGTLWQLYWHFLAHWDAVKMTCSEGVQGSRRRSVQQEIAGPSFATFQRRWHAVWQHYLRFRKKSEHAQCNTCFKLQQVMYDAGQGVEEKMEAARHLREHVRCTYLDRTIYWNLRFASRCYNDVLVIIIDAMDKTKFAWPRYPFRQQPKDLAELVRPRLTFTCAMAHGYCVDLYMATEQINHGASAFNEILCRTITNVKKICRERGLPFPQHLVVQSDNTVSQAKNQHACLFLATLVARRYFRTVNLCFLTVGHTHEDIGLQRI